MMKCESLCLNNAGQINPQTATRKDVAVFDAARNHARVARFKSS
jgi:hypothetical protein